MKTFAKYQKGHKVRPAFCELLSTCCLDIIAPIVQELPEIVPLLLSGPNRSSKTLPTELVRVQSPPQGTGEEEEETKVMPGAGTAEMDNEKFRLQVLDLMKEIWDRANKSSWRNLVMVIRVIPKLQAVFPGSEYTEYFMDELLTLMCSGNAQSKAAAAQSFCLLLSRTLYSFKRESYLSKAMVLAQSSSCYARLGCLEFAAAAVDTFSQAFLREHRVLHDMCELAADKVAKVRLKFVHVASRISGKLREDLLSVLVSQVTSLQGDSDRVVKKESEKCVLEMKQGKELPELGETDATREKAENELLALVPPIRQA